MELIPILSLIILVATISTFVLAVGAYILFKIRERRGQKVKEVKPASIPAELVAPAPLISEAGTTSVPHTNVPTFDEAMQASRITGSESHHHSPTYFTSTHEGDPNYPEMRPTFSSRTNDFSESRYTKSASRYSKDKDYNKEKENGDRDYPSDRRSRDRDSERSSTRSTSTGSRKFMRYTNDGYVDPSKSEKKKEDNLRWR